MLGVKGGRLIKGLGLCALTWGLVIIAFITLLARPPWGALAGWLVVDEPLTSSDVLIVLSGNPERELYAVELYRSGLADKIVMSGPPSAVRTMKKQAVDRGVKAGDIILEEESWSTYQNAVNSSAIVLQRGMESAIVITSDYHTRRSRMVFRRVFKDTGINLLFSAAPGLSPGADTEYDEERRRQILKEYVKLVYYWMRYW